MLWNRLIASACIAIFLVACNGSPPSPLRIGSSPWPGYEPLYLARDLGYLAPDTYKLFELPSADITVESFRNRSTDLATLTLDEALELMHDGVKLRILYVLDISEGADAVMAGPNISKPADLKGKRIAIENIPLGFYMLSRLLDTAGLTRNDVTIIPMSETKQDLYYRQGKADAVITFEPFKSQLADAGAHVVFDSSQIPHEIFDLMLVHEDVYQQRREELCQLTRQWFRALDYMKDQPTDAAQRISKRLGVTVKGYHQMMQGLVLPTRDENKQLLGGNSPALLQPAKKLATIMQNEKQIASFVDAGVAIDPALSQCYAQ